jgi:hypothetical protein
MGFFDKSKLYDRGFRFEEIPKSNLQEKPAPDPKTRQIRLLRQVQSSSLFNGFEKLHERVFRNVVILFEPSAQIEYSDMRCRCTAVE